METLPYEIGETAHAVKRAFARRAAHLGITGAQAKVLLRLTRNPGLRQVELADILDIEPITLTRMIDRLEEAGYVERAADPADRRAWRLQLTDTAQPLVVKLKAIAAELVEEAFAGIDPKDIATTRRVLAQARENVTRSAPISRALNQ
ncbi:MarR family winged helix-turn-helix transcriptional regulator [Sphingomonas sp. URHD0057]|uniref:MarR family winged helix-turn-helix transcriptional regulator n=1 Tax=Sphingomonas sp. URHD0057 TaxID=1380389 RepID=UPI000563A469|nr:MarR family transcriptional regulator [Sphingomonas sp. URHD0057]